jgi:hypothetical protein
MQLALMAVLRRTFLAAFGAGKCRYKVILFVILMANILLAIEVQLEHLFGGVLLKEQLYVMPIAFTRKHAVLLDQSISNLVLLLSLLLRSPHLWSREVARRICRETVRTATQWLRQCGGRGHSD